jgi:hypothetical protein
MCRSQQAFHEERASEATLKNVRIISAKAAIAWGKEALFAEQREDREKRRRVVADAIALEEPCLTEEQWLSENPDRGLASS